jgi:hypothetical protein
MATKANNRPYSEKSHALEPRGRPVKGQPPLSGATASDPLVTMQVVKVRRSVWAELTKAAEEKTWHRSVYVRALLDEWMRKRMAGKASGGAKRSGNGKQKAA